MNLVKPGKYTAKIVEYGLPEPKPGKHPQVALTFEFKDEAGATRQLTYFGSMSPAATEFTIKNLLVCGMKNDSISSLLRPHAFEDKEVIITVAHEEYEGKTRAKVKWINSLAGAKYKNIAPEVASNKFGELTSYISAMRKEQGIATTPSGQDFSHANDFDLEAE